MKEKSNIVWIDVAKALSMIMIFYSHTKTYWGIKINDYSFYGPMCVNIFFFISGYLLLSKQLSPTALALEKGRRTELINKQLKNIFFRLILPAILFSAVEYFPARLIKHEGITLSSFLLKTVGGGTYWFISALVVAELLICLFLYFGVKNVWSFFLISFVISASVVIMISKGYPLFFIKSTSVWMYKQGMISLLFCALGGIYWKYEQKIRAITDKNWVVILMVIAYVLGLVCLFPYIKCMISTLEINALGIVVSTWGVLTLVALCQRIPHFRIVEFVGKNTMGYYLLCASIPIVLCKILKTVFCQQAFIGWLLLFISSLFVVGGVVYLLKRLVPFVFDLRLLKDCVDRRKNKDLT